MDLATARHVLDTLVAFPTVSRDSNLALIDWVEGFLGAHGIASVRIPAPCGTKAQLYATTGPEVAGGTVLSGHSDVVPVDGQPWTTDPWRVVERDGRLYGRGTCDMKGFVALSIAALVAARQAPLKRPLALALSCDEEVGCMAVIDLVRAMTGALPRPAAVIVGEPTSMRVVTGHKGGAGLAVHLRGHEVHSSLLHQGISAIMEGARLIDWANARNAENAACPPGPLAAAFVPPWTTLHVGKIEGGTAHNITARDCRFFIEVRAVPGEAVEEWVARFEAEAATLSAKMAAVHPDARITIERAFAVPALVPEDRGAAEALARRITGDNGTHVVSYGTEAGQFQAVGHSTVVCGPGDIAQAHQPDEFLTVAEFAAGWRFMEGVIADLAR